MEEHFFQCPYCWEHISMLLDSSVSEQTFIEDCEICCNPIEVQTVFQNERLIQFEIQPVGQ